MGEADVPLEAVGDGRGRQVGRADEGGGVARVAVEEPGLGMQAGAAGVVGDLDLRAAVDQIVQHPAIGGAHVGGGEHAEAAGMAVEEAAGVIAEQPPPRPLKERDQEVDTIG